jgi:hypothetical protein
MSSAGPQGLPFLVSTSPSFQWGTNRTNMVKSKHLIALAAVLRLSEGGHDIIAQYWFYVGIRRLFWRIFVLILVI